MSRNLFGLLKNQVFPGTEVFDEEDTERERERESEPDVLALLQLRCGTFVPFCGTLATPLGTLLTSGTYVACHMAL